MTEEPIVTFTIALNDPELGPEEQEEIVQNWLNLISNLDEVERVERLENPNPTEKGMPGVEWLIGVLTAQVSWKNITPFIAKVATRIINRPIRIKVKVKDTEMEIEATTIDDFEKAKKIAEEIRDSMRNN